MRHLLLSCFISLICSASVNAAVYKQVDADGNVIFTDVPTKKDETPIKVAPPAMTYTPTIKATTPHAPPDKKKSQATQYTSLSILEPENAAVIRANGGTIAVSISSEPKLDTESKHRYAILLDGQAMQEGSSTNISISNVDRGPHSLQAQILDEQNRVLVSSESISIDVLRFSILAPKPTVR